MNFMYMDESGKNIISNPKGTIYLFGGLLIDKKNVFPALNVFKGIYQKHKNELKKYINSDLDGKVNADEKAKRMGNMFMNFEIHATDLFNPTREDKKKNKENPWKYYPDTERFRLIHEIFIGISPFIENVLIFKVDKSELISYFGEKGIKDLNDDIVDEMMIGFIVEEYDYWLKDKNKKGSIIPDKLDSKIRDTFVNKMEKYSSDLFWSEPIVVDSSSNAFTQVIDIITYVYYIIYIQKKKTPNYAAIEKAYENLMKTTIEEKDLIDHLILKEKVEKEKAEKEKGEKEKGEKEKGEKEKGEKEKGD